MNEFYSSVNRTNVQRSTSRHKGKIPTYEMFPTKLVFAAAYAVYKARGFEYIGRGNTTLDENGNLVAVQSNSELIESYLKDPTKLSEEDHEMGEKIQFYYKAFTFKVLANENMSDFEVKAMTLAGTDEIGSNCIGVISYLPHSYSRDTHRAQMQEKLDSSSGYLGEIGEKVTFSGIVLRSIASVKYGCYYPSILTENNQVLFFSSKQHLAVGSTVSGHGKVKAHCENNKTQLSHVKLAE